MTNHTHVWRILNGAYPPPGWSKAEMHRGYARTVEAPIRLVCDGCPKDKRMRETTVSVTGLFSGFKVIRWLEELNAEERRHTNETPLHELLKEISTW